MTLATIIMNMAIATAVTAFVASVAVLVPFVLHQRHMADARRSATPLPHTTAHTEPRRHPVDERTYERAAA